MLKQSAPRLSQRLDDLAAAPPTTVTNLGGLLRHFGERAHELIAFLLVMPFLQPIPLPFVSTPFGIAAASMGLQMALNRPPWLPKRLAERPLSHEALERIARAGARWLRRFEHLVRPRVAFFHAHPVLERVAGGLIAVLGVLLSLPLPVPISNFLPALSIALLALGNLEEDGLVVVFGYVAFTLTLVFFAAIALLPLLGIDFVAAMRGLVHW